MQRKEKGIIKGVFLIVLFYVFFQHFTAVKLLAVRCYQAVSPLIYGIGIAFVLNLIVVWMERYLTKGIFQNNRVRRITSIVLSVVILTGGIAIICFALIPEIVVSVKQIAAKTPQTFEHIVTILEERLGLSQDVINQFSEFEFSKDMLEDMFGLIENHSVIEAIKASGNVVGSVFSVIGRFFIGLFFAFYILAQKESIGAFVHRMVKTYLPARTANTVEYVGHLVYETFSNFITGQCLDAMILGLMLTICMGIMGLPYPGLIGVIVAVTALIPVVGAFFGGTVGVLLLIMDSPIQAVTFLVLFLILQQIDNRLIYPHVVGGAIGIPSILIFAAIVIGAEFGGVLGMFLGIPLTAVLYTIVVDDMAKRNGGRVKDSCKPL